MVGKYLESTHDILLVRATVDGQIPNSSSCYVPTIYSGDIVYVREYGDDVAVIANVSSDDWKVCELPVEMLDDCVVLSQQKLDAIL